MAEVYGIDRARKVLGNAVHPKALQRLFEIWPEAHVQMTYGRYDGRRTTTVKVSRHPGASALGEVLIGKAHCNPEDEFRRSVGIDLAFRRALSKVRKAAY